jgi:hypothetical protein
MTTYRPIHIIADEIRQHGGTRYFGAVPYVDAMTSLHSIGDMYFADSGRSIVLYFLANAKTWRGPVAKRIKAELKAMLDGKPFDRLAWEAKESAPKVKRERSVYYIYREHRDETAWVLLRDGGGIDSRAEARRAARQHARSFKTRVYVIRVPLYGIASMERRELDGYAYAVREREYYTATASLAASSAARFPDALRALVERGVPLALCITGEDR